TPRLKPYLWLIPPGVLFIGSYQVASKWAIRNKSFTHIARTKVTQTFGMLLLQLGGYKFGPAALIGGQVSGQALGTTSLTLAALKNPIFKCCTWAGIQQQASRYRAFPLYSTWTGLFNTASLQ